MTNETYDRIKWIALIFLPALGTLYYAVAIIWNLPYAEEVVATITAIDTFLGALVKYSADKYYTNMLGDYSGYSDDTEDAVEEDDEKENEDGENL